ncbi:MAG: CHASE domain-containing protein, partial [Algicola sp.]|nr:CHASE domain-containing protein [Algicola sp.]
MHFFHRDGIDLYNRLGKVLALFVSLLGVVVLVGWTTHNTTLIQVSPHLVPMQYNTALGFVLCGLGTYALLIEQKNLTSTVALILITLGIATLSQYIFGVDFAIDELFMRHYIDLNVSHPGRMAPNTALCFALCGLTLFFAVHKPSIYTSAILAAIILALAVVAFTGYLMKVETAYGWGKLTKMAVHTSVGFLVTGMALMLHPLVLSIKREKNSLRWLVAPITITGLSISVMLFQSLTQSNAASQLLTSSYAGEAILVFGLSLTALVCYALVQQSRRDNANLGRIAIYASIYLGALLSFSVFQLTLQNAQETIKVNFVTKAKNRVQAIKLSIEPYFETLYTVQTAFHANPNIDRAKFKSLVTRQVARYKAIKALEWVPKVPIYKVDDLYQAAQDSGFDDFEVFEFENGEKILSSSKSHDVYYPVFYAEPYSVNLKAVGFNVSSIAHVKNALDLSLINNKPAVSGRLTLIDTDKNGILMVLPIYKPNLEIKTLEQRKKALAGYAMSVVDIGPMVTYNLNRYIQVGGIHIIFNDLSAAGAQLHVHHSRLASAIPLAKVDHKKALIYKTQLKMGVKDWQITVIAADPQQYAVNMVELIPLPNTIFLLSLLLAYYLHSSLTKQVEREQLLNYQSALLEAMPNPVVVKDKQLKIKAVNKAFEKAFGIKREDILGSDLLNTDFFPEDVREQFFQEDRYLIEHGGDCNREMQLRFGDGCLHDVLYMKTAFELAGKPQGVIALTVDMTVQQRQKRQTDAIFQNLTDGVGLL